MRYWFDTEFIEDGKTIELLSIGIVAQDGRTLYLENIEADRSAANQWVKDNVLPYLMEPHEVEAARLDTHPVLVERTRIAEKILEFMDPEKYGKPEIWAYYADYDWVAFCQLFGKMIDLPAGFPMYCRDIKQWADMLGNPKLPAQTSTEHHALADARWNRTAWEFLLDHQQTRPVMKALEEQARAAQ